MIKKANLTKKVDKIEYYQAIGRRKEATANIKLYVGINDNYQIKDIELKPGKMYVNNIEISKYFSGSVFEKLYNDPFRITNTLGRFGVVALIKGGGPKGQLDAFIHGTARALEKVDKENYRPILKSRGLLKRDSRVKERRKAGFAQKARAKKQSPKR
jgi:small subunit ribosomal protein S9